MIPTYLRNSILYSHITMDDLKFCVVCFKADIKMFTLKITRTDSLGNIYSQLAQIPIHNPNQHVCYQCAALLYKYNKFKSKCRQAHIILYKLQCEGATINKDVIRNINKTMCNKDCYIRSPMVIHNEPGIINIPPKTKVNSKMNGEEYKNMVIDIASDSDDEMENQNVTIPKEANMSNKSLNHSEICADIVSEGIYIIETGDIQDENDLNLLENSSQIDENIEECNEDDEPIEMPTRNNNEQLIVDKFKNHATVVFLSPEDSRNEILKRKESEKYLRAQYKCNLCFRGFGINVAFEHHMKKHSDVYGKHECNICHYRYPNQSKLRNHVTQFHRVKFCCKICPKAFNSGPLLMAHIRFHEGVRYPCEYCGKEFSKDYVLAQHVRSHLKEMKQEWPCGHCGSIFVTEKGVGKHQQLMHPEEATEDGPLCDECEVQFHSEMAWKRHLVLSSKHTVTNGCNVCGETFASAKELRTHKANHPFRTKFQKKLYAGITWPANCDICGVQLATGKLFNKHYRQAHPDSATTRRILALKAYMCEMCGRSFHSSTLLKYHQRVHTDERPFKCDQCDAAYTLKSHLIKHKTQKHKRRKALRGNVCGKETNNHELVKRKRIHGARHDKPVDEEGHTSDLKQHIRLEYDKDPEMNDESQSEEAIYILECEE